ncbi:MAG: polysaccharide biosynthesis tyrosine autokinase [Planctomycetes bacterium]|nr:polysaccharide biosynthesis tyrosine autokinase [Planctomycetota bacterium]
MSYNIQRQTVSDAGVRPAGPATRDMAAAGSMLSLSDILGALRRHMVMIIVLFVLIAGAGTAATLYQYRYNPTYQATATIVVTPGTSGSQQQGIIETVEQRLPANVIESFINDQIRRIREDNVLQMALSEGVADRIIRELNRETERIQGGDASNPASLDEADRLVRERTRRIRAALFPEGETEKNSMRARVKELQETLQVSTPYRTWTIEVSLKGKDPALVADIVNSVLESYMLAYSAGRKRLEQHSLSGLVAQQKELKKPLDDAARDLAGQRDMAVMPFLGADRPDIASEVRYYEDEFAKVDLEVVQLQILQAQIAGGAEGAEQAPQATHMTPEMQLRMEEDRALVNLRGVLATLKRERETYVQQGYGKAHQVVLAVDAQISRTEEEITTREAELLDVLVRQEKEALLATLQGAMRRREEISKRLQDAKARVRDMTSAMIDYERYNRVYDGLQRQMDMLTEAIIQQQIRAEVSSNSVQIWREAIPPDRSNKAGPNPLLYVPASILAGLIVSIGMALLVELIDNRVRTPVQVIRNVQMTVLGTVPDAREDQAARKASDLAHVTTQASQSLVAESFRQLRTALLYSTDTELKTLLVTSPKADEGKTIVACNLAATLAMSGCRVLLIDTNFRRPRIHRLFDLPNSVGLSSVLARLSSFGDAVRSTNVANLDVLSCGPVPPSPADLLGSEAMQNLLVEARQRYDNIILDSTPVLVVADSHVLCSMVDGVTMVINCQKTSRGVATRTKRMLLGFRARVVGAVLNRIRAQKGGYFREAYRNYYDYAKQTGGETPAMSASTARTSAATALDDLGAPGGDERQSESS